MSEPTENDTVPEAPPTIRDHHDDQEPSDNDAMNHEGAVDENGFPDPDDFYDP